MASVTIGHDGLPTIMNPDGTIYPRRAELIFHKQYYPNWPDETWPIDPGTKQKLPIAGRSDMLLQRHVKGDNRGGRKTLAKCIRRLVQAIFGNKPFRQKDV